MKIPVHKDKLGRELSIGDAVCYPSHNSLYIGTVVKLNPKLVGVTDVGTNWKSQVNKYSYDLVKLDGADLTFYVLQNSQ
jgi:hypothetical protein